MRILVLGLLGACTSTDGAPHRETNLAGLGEVALSMSIGDRYVDVQVYYNGACAELGSDFGGTVGGSPLSTFAGGWETVCNAPTNSEPCIPAPDRCAEPELGFADLPLAHPATIRFGDASRTIECDVGDDLVPRTLTRTNGTTWDLVPGELVTAKWSPGGDVPRFGLQVKFDASFETPAVPSTVNADEVSFTVPPDLGYGLHFLSVSTGGTVTSKCGGVTNTLSIGYTIEQHFISG